MLVFGAHKYIWSRLFVFIQSLFAFSLISSLTGYSTLPALALAAWTAVSFASSPDFWPCQIFDTWNKNVPWKLLLKIMEPCHTFDTWDRNLVICTLTRNGVLSKNTNLNKWKWTARKWHSPPLCIQHRFQKASPGEHAWRRSCSQSAFTKHFNSVSVYHGHVIMMTWSLDIGKRVNI